MGETVPKPGRGDDPDKESEMIAAKRQLRESEIEDGRFGNETRGGSRNQHDAKIHDIRECGTGDEQIANGAEEIM